MSTSYGGLPLGITGTHYGAAALGVPGASVPTEGLNGASYLRGGLSSPADDATEVRGVITRWPTLGTLVAQEDGSFSYTGATDYAEYRLYVAGPASTVDIGYGAGIGRFTLTVGAGGASTLSGDIALDAAAAAGSFGTAAQSQLSGAVSLDAAVPGGGLGAAGPSIMGAAVTLDPVEPGGAMVGDVSQVLPSMDAGRRNIRPGRAAAQWLLPLDPDEVDNLSADFSAVFGPADPLINAQVTCEARQGVDPSTTPLMFGAWQLHGQVVRQRLKGSLGVPGVTYLVRVRGISASGEVAVAAGLMKLARLS